MQRRNSKSFRERKVPNFPNPDSKKETKNNEQSFPSHNNMFVIKTKRVSSFMQKQDENQMSKKNKIEGSKEYKLQKTAFAQRGNLEKSNESEKRKINVKAMTQLLSYENKLKNVGKVDKTDLGKKITFVAFLKKKKKKEVEKIETQLCEGEEEQNKQQKFQGFNDELCESIILPSDKNMEKPEPPFKKRRSFIERNDKKNDENGKINENNTTCRRSVSIRNSKSRKKKINECKTLKIKWGNDILDLKVSAIQPKGPLKEQLPPESLKQLFKQLI